MEGACWALLTSAPLSMGDLCLPAYLDAMRQVHLRNFCTVPQVVKHQL